MKTANKRFFTVKPVTIYTSEREITHWLGIGYERTMCGLSPLLTGQFEDMSNQCWVEYADDGTVTVSDTVTCKHCRRWMLAGCAKLEAGL